MVIQVNERKRGKKDFTHNEEVNHRAYKLYKNLKKLYKSVHVARFADDVNLKGNLDLEKEVDCLDWGWLEKNIGVFSHIMILSSWDQDTTSILLKGIRKHNSRATVIYESYDWLTSWITDEESYKEKVNGEQYLVKHADKITFRYPGLIKERLHKLQKEKPSIYLPDPLSELDFKNSISKDPTKKKAMLYIGNVQLDYHRSLIEEARIQNLTYFINPRHPEDISISEEGLRSPSLPYSIALTISEISRNYDCYGLIINHSRLPKKYIDENGYTDDISDVAPANKLFDYLETDVSQQLKNMDSATSN